MSVFEIDDAPQRNDVQSTVPTQRHPDARETSDAGLTMHVRVSRSLIVLKLYGELDAGTCHILRDTVESTLLSANPAALVILDASRLTACDEFGHDAIARACEALRGHGVELVVQSPSQPTDRQTS